MATKKIQILDSLNKNAVLYTPQELTEEEKMQVRENLNIPSLDENGRVPLEQLPDDIGGGSGGDIQEVFILSDNQTEADIPEDVLIAVFPDEDGGSGSSVDLSDYYTKTEIDSHLSNKMDIIAVTEADNGKFLQVVNGVWTAVNIPNAEEASFG